jgi:hypothetical protein
MLDQTKVRDAPQQDPHRQEAQIQPAGVLFQNQFPREVHMGMVMVKCPQTGRAIPTGIETDRESFRRSPVFFARTRCPICHADHAWFAQEAWVNEPSTRARRIAGSLA